MRTGIAGFGVIGRATASVFVDVEVYDPLKGFPDPRVLTPCEVVFICVPTPTQDGVQHLGYVRQCLAEVAPVLRDGQVVALRSTVLPGTCRALQREYPRLLLASNPEFLRAHRALDDVRHPARIVVGADSSDARATLVRAYHASLVPEPCRRLVLTDTLTAELIKYAANCYLAVKISYFNEVFDICTDLGGDYESLRTALGLDPRVAPGDETYIHPRRRGFDDECLPKDLSAFIGFLTGRGFAATLFQAAEEVNREVRSPQECVTTPLGLSEARQTA